jgi:hypothetical protein
MRAFVNLNTYQDYLKVIQDNLGQEFRDHQGFLFLLQEEREDVQNKLIKIFNIIDSELSYSGSKNNEMWKKLRYILPLGIYLKKYPQYFNELKTKELGTFILSNASLINNNSEDFIKLLSNQRLIEAIENDYKDKQQEVFGMSDYFFMIEQHFKNKPFDVNDDKLRNEFIDLMIYKINTNSLHENVKNMIEYWNEIKDEVEMQLRGVNDDETRRF